MGKITMILPLALIGAFAFAGTIDCSGTYEGYDFSLTGTVTNNEVTGQIPCTISQSGSVVSTQQLTAGTSAIKAGTSLDFSASNSEISATVTTNYQNGKYVGQAVADTSEGDFTVPMTCTLSE